MADFVANFLELWGVAYLGPFSQYMYKADLYFVLTILAIDCAVCVL